MIGAIVLVKLPDGFVGGYELESLLIAISISLLIMGPGRLSVEYDVLKREIFPKGRAIIQKQREALQKV
jgi:putative oxidoreductase